jgi:CO dehydrogenase maturation factor
MGKSIAVAGKGGTGKTTIAALLVLELIKRKQGPVLGIDADPDANLGALLGIDVKQTIGDLREEVLEELKNFPAGMSKAEYVQAGLHQIIEETEGFDLITMGRGEGSGCYCYLNLLVRKFSEDLFPSYRWIVMDNEAGLEHISRRTTYNIDAMIVVVNDNPISINTAERIIHLSSTLKNKIKKLYVVTNMVRKDRKEAVLNRIEGLKVDYLGDIPYDEALGEVLFSNRSLADLSDSAAKDKVSKILDTIGGSNGDT